MTKFWNHVVNFCMVSVAVLAAMPTHIVDFVPPKYKEYVVGAVGIAIWVNSHRNLFVNPDGTPASVAYKKPEA